MSLWRQRFRLAKQKPHRRVGGGVRESLSVELRPDRHAAQQQRVVKQQSVFQFAIHGVTTSAFSSSSQIESIWFCQSLLFRFVWLQHEEASS